MTKPNSTKWKFLPGNFGGGNHVLKGKGFYISFNANAGSGISFFRQDTAMGETALVKPDDSKKFRILNGDFRKEYEALVPKGWKACLKFFNSKAPELESSWSGK